MNRIRHLIDKIELETFGGKFWVRKEAEDCQNDGRFVFKFSRHVPIFLGYVHIYFKSDAGFMGIHQNLFTLEFHEPNYQEDVYVPFDKLQLNKYLTQIKMQRIKFW